LLVEDVSERLAERSVVLYEQDAMHVLPFADSGEPTRKSIYQLWPHEGSHGVLSSRAGELSGLPAAQGGEAHPEKDPGPSAFPALHLELPAKREDALAHPR
jgi:hypothetical protein